MEFKILYEDSNILAIDKPSGVAVHSDGRNKEKTVADWFLKKYPRTRNVGESIFVDGKEVKKPGIVHRLDKETSGVLLLVKNQKAYEFLKNQFSVPALRLKTKSGLTDKQDGIRKTYVAIVSGWMKNDRGTIRKPIGRSGNDFRKRLAGRGARGELREAITEYTVLKRFEDKNIKFSYLEVRPKTGRTHQIRVHMKFVNHPIINDSLYNPNKPHPKGFDRLGLHAKSIEFKNLNGKIVKVEAPLPKEFIEVLK